MKKTLQGFLRKPVGIIAAAVLAIAMIAGTAAVADFTLSHRAKRVIAAYESGEKLFSSNYLRQGTDSRFGTPVLATIYVDASEQETGSITETVSVCNYVQGNHSRWFDRNIPYTLRAQIVELEPDPEHDGKLRIKSTTAPTGTSIAVAGVTKSLEGSGVIQSFSKTLASDAASADTYTVSFPASMLQTSQYYLWLEATPQDGLGLDTIAVLLNVQRQQTVTLNNWTLEQRDDTNNSIGQYSGFNYQLYGTGKGSMTLGIPQSSFWTNTLSTSSAPAETAPLRGSSHSRSIRTIRTAMTSAFIASSAERSAAGAMWRSARPAFRSPLPRPRRRPANNVLPFRLRIAAARGKQTALLNGGPIA